MNSYLSPEQVIHVASELNHLLWTNDPPPIPDEVAHFEYDVPPINMQCTSHSIVCAMLLSRRGAEVTSRGGSACVVEQKRANRFMSLNTGG
jgi:hypothetical protein